MAQGINHRGQIVGYYYDNAGNAHGFLYSSGTYTTLDYPDGGFTTANGINDAGQIVGNYNGGIFIYSGGTYTAVDISSGYVAHGINNKGQIVGYYGNHGFLATPDVCFAKGMPVLYFDKQGNAIFMQVSCH